MRAYRLSPEEVIAKINQATTVLPSGSVRTGDLLRFASTNAALGPNIAELLDTPLRLGSGPTVYLRDIGTIADSTDVVVGYAHVDGKRTVYIPVTKRADASTLSVIQNVRQALPRMRNVAPEDVKIDLVFDQSGYVVSALKGLIQEGLLGACLTGLMVLLFLRDWRSALIVIITIPFALLSAVVSLWITGQTINIMTLGGLALAVGVLVDEATVEIENIHSHMSGGLSRARSVVDACRKTAAPKVPGHALRFVRLHAVAFHDRRWTPVVCAAFPGRRFCHGLFLLAVEHPGSGPLHLVDSPPARKATGTLRQAAVQLTVTASVSFSVFAGSWRGRTSS